MIKTKFIFPISLLLIVLSISSLSFKRNERSLPLSSKSFDSITAAMVNYWFHKTNAKSVHSRLFFNSADISRIKSLLDKKDTVIALAYAQLNKEANEILKQPLLSYSLDDANLRIPSIHRFASQVPSLVMMYQLTANKIFADRCYAQLEKFATYPDWGANRHFLDTGIGAFDFALAYDGLYDYLNDEQKKVLKDAVLKQVLLPAKKQTEENKWWHTSHNNWNGICNGGIIMAALAMYEDDQALMSNIIANAANGLPNYIKEFEPDGQSEEGLSYWGYGLMYTSIAMEAMQRVLGTSFDLDNTNGFRKTGWFPLYVSGPVTSLSYGDDNVKNSKSQSFFWFAKRFNDSALAKFQYDLCIENKRVNWGDMIYYDPSLIKESANQQNQSTEHYIHGIEAMSLRDKWNDNALFISMHGGKNNASHGHLDAGSFDIQAMGEVWAYGDLGSDNYTYPGYFSKTTKPGYYDAPAIQTEAGRWHIYRLRAEGKNCLVFNPATNPDQNEAGEAKLLKQNIGVNESYYILDLTNCYQRDVKEYTRKIQLNKTSKIISVEDNFVTTKVSTVWWGMHTKANITIQANGKTAQLQIKNKKMIVSIKSPAGAVFQVLDATYLPGESFPLTKNSGNKAYKKLVFQLENQSANKICVEFYADKN